MTTATLPSASPRPGLFSRLFVSVFFWAVRKRIGLVPKPLQIMSASPRVLFAYGMFEYACEGATKLDPRLKALANFVFRNPDKLSRVRV